MIRIVAVVFLLIHAPLAAAITAADFIKHARDSVTSSVEAAQAARLRLAALMARDRDIHSSVRVKMTKSVPGPLPIYVVPLDRLQAFDERTSALDILMPANRVYYLVSYPMDSTSPGQLTALSSVELMNTPVGWRTAVMGGASYAESVWKTLQDVEQDAILVQVPALALHFVAFTRDGQHLEFSLIAGASDIPVPEREPSRAEAVLLKLVPLAKRHNGLID